MDLGEVGLDFGGADVLEALREGGEDGGFAVLAGADDEGEAEAGVVGAVVLVELVGFFRGEAVEAGGALFGGGLGGEAALFGEGADEVGVGADEP